MKKHQIFNQRKMSDELEELSLQVSYLIPL